jgi:hypothetical protein
MRSAFRQIPPFPPLSKGGGGGILAKGGRRGDFVWPLTKVNRVGATKTGGAPADAPCPDGEEQE